ncbi:GNAT family N-acetyltransferase [Limosilactobacillus caecicola]|uniref:GNAT family N-acetyltransferase n=1 Tax=Limosilactobacillus caecicola TaxID=2941332 RepID=UPI00203C4323|nr:GNAT family N-acetyltransferase [Limosilactobacillus caecicola]
MKLDARTVSTHLTDYDQIKQLYHTAFPAEEQVSWSSLMHKSHSKHVEFLAYYVDSEFVGMTYVIRHSNTNLLFYFAIADGARDHGYGGQIIDWLQEKYPNEPLVIEVEPDDPQAPNLEQRQRRFKFYHRHGFHEIGHQVVEEGVPYEILSTDPTFDVQLMKPIYRWFSFPFINRSKLEIK